MRPAIVIPSIIGVTEMSSRWISIAEAAERISVSDQTIRRIIKRKLVKAKQLKVVGTTRGHWRIEENSLEALLVGDDDTQDRVKVARDRMAKA